jgi:hypothetical protein
VSSAKKGSTASASSEMGTINRFAGIRAPAADVRVRGDGAVALGATATPPLPGAPVATTEAITGSSSPLSE